MCVRVKQALSCFFVAVLESITVFSVKMAATRLKKIFNCNYSQIAQQEVQLTYN